ncbi:MAG: radical SAM protein [Oscillospiraceae bacterium]|jgi:nitrogenase molybdenum-iron protein alpha/beta subunit/MoaA/NifB/PqqE/SkfB family radical SAM enzyme|nr:radical SAM protein [Oscillospiraceae bacterium]
MSANPNLVSLNVNPCKMCMPMGALTALCGIRGCMSILHGSQGCATYIRRHMATHYNEPIDIASSSLTEQGTVFGGEANLLKGLRNLIELYRPEVVGVCTSCLAETIGEDVGAILQKFRDENPEVAVKLINVASPGYGGTQNEGFFAALRAIAAQVEPDTAPNGKINLVVPMLSPADTRWLKAFAAEMGLEFILLPDLSENLDGATAKTYERLKSGGTPLSEIAQMAGARMTLEFSGFVRPEASPAVYLRETYGVPFIRLPLPVGIRAMDALTDALVQAGGVVTDDMRRARGRYLDAMVDSHKYSAQARAAIFGDPDFVQATVRLCCENGIVPVLAATGSVCPELEDALAPEIEACRAVSFIEDTRVLDDCDFDTIEAACRELGVNLMIGSSDGRRAAHRLGVPLIRCAFPIHDHVGGQRVRTLGFEGSLNLLDRAANAMLDKTESGFRNEMYDNYYTGARRAIAPAAPKTDRTATHPCFGEHACGNARVHLPVAPECNIQCNYCVRDFDCANESRPGVTSRVLTPAQAFERSKTLKSALPNLTVAGIAGPGDALANFDATRETLRLIREFDPDVTFCVSTNGLLLPQYAAELCALGVSHVTVTVNAVDPAVGARVYKHIRYMGSVYTGIEGASILLANQLAGVKMLTDLGVTCKINCVALQGVNDAHIFEVTRKAASLGAYMTNIMPHIPVPGSGFEGLGRLTDGEISALRETCGVNIRQMTHCRQCRADAAGTLGNDVPLDAFEAAESPNESGAAWQRFAVATRGGVTVDTHFGHAREFYIFESDGADTRFIETREVSKYCTGPADCDDKEDRWASVLRAVADCGAVLALRIGEVPLGRLEDVGIRAVTTSDRIETAVALAARESTNVTRV